MRTSVNEAMQRADKTQEDELFVLLDLFRLTYVPALTFQIEVDDPFVRGQLNSSVTLMDQLLAWIHTNPNPHLDGRLLDQIRIMEAELEQGLRLAHQIPTMTEQRRFACMVCQLQLHHMALCIQDVLEARAKRQLAVMQALHDTRNRPRLGTLNEDLLRRIANHSLQDAS